MDKASVLAAFNTATKEVLLAAKDMADVGPLIAPINVDALIVALVDRILQAEAIERSERRVVGVPGTPALRSVN